MDYDYLPASGGAGDPPKMTIMADRLTGATSFTVDTTTNANSKFIGTTGTLLSTGKIDPATKRDFKGHVVDPTHVALDAWEPGSTGTDPGSTSGQVIIIKPNTGWANRIASHIKNMTGFGTPENVTVDDITASGNATIAGNASIAGNLAVTGTFRPKPRVSSTTATATLTPNIDNFNIYDLTAQNAALAIANPTGTPNNGDPLIIRIKDDGTARAITYGTAYQNVSGLDLITTTTIGKWIIIGIQYNAAVSKWQILSLSTEA